MRNKREIVGGIDSHKLSNLKDWKPQIPHVLLKYKDRSQLRILSKKNIPVLPLKTLEYCCE